MGVEAESVVQLGADKEAITFFLLERGRCTLRTMVLLLKSVSPKPNSDVDTKNRTLGSCCALLLAATNTRRGVGRLGTARQPQPDETPMRACLFMVNEEPLKSAQRSGIS